MIPAFFLCGCSVNQTKEMQIYRKVLDAGKSESAAPFDPGEPLTLKRALRLANTHNEQLAVAGENYLQALIDKDRAFANFLPTIAFVPTFMHQEKIPLEPGNPFLSKIVRDKTTDVPAQGSMRLSPFQDVPALGAAKSSAEQQRALMLDRQAIVLLDVAQTYFQVMRSEKQVQVLKHSMEVQQQRLEDVTVKRRVGTARPVDVSLVEAQLAKTHNALIQSQNDVSNGRAMLALLVGVPAVDGMLVGGLEVPSADWRLESLLTLAGTHRQDLLAAHAQVQAAAQSLESAWGRYFPSVSLNLAGYLYRESFPNNVDWTSMIEVNVPLFSAGLVYADVRTAYSRLRQARFAESNMQRSVLKDLKVALEDLHDDAKQIEQLTIQVKSAQEGVRQADAAFNAGLGTNLERLVAQDALLSAELALATEQFNRNVDYLRLLRMTGILDPDLSASLPPVTSALSSEKIAGLPAAFVTAAGIP
jgi:outer membrane protein TolC